MQFIYFKENCKVNTFLASHSQQAKLLGCSKSLITKHNWGKQNTQNSCKPRQSNYYSFRWFLECVCGTWFWNFVLVANSREFLHQRKYVFHFNIWKKTCIVKREGCIIWLNKMIKIPAEVFNSASSKKPLACHLHILMTSEREIMLFHPWF